MKTSIIASLLALAAMTIAAPVTEPQPQPETSMAPAHKLFARETCQTFYGYDVSVDDANSCANMLIGYGTRTCVVAGRVWTDMCHNGGAHVWGRARDGGSTSSYCRDVGHAIQQIVKDCAKDGVVAGTNEAIGNGELSLWLRSGNPN